MIPNTLLALVLTIVLLPLAGCDDDDDNDDGATTTTAGPALTTSSTLGGPGTTIDGTTTTVTINGGAFDCDVTFSVTSTATIGALQFEVAYTQAPGQFAGEGDQVDCTDLTTSLATFNDRDAQRTLSAGLISLTGFSTPADVVVCTFAGAPSSMTLPQPDDFVVTVVDATDPQLAPVTADMAVDVSCGAGPTTTVSTSTTTVTTTTSTTFAGPIEGIGFTMVGTTARVGALQLTIDYSAAPGGFDGSAADVECTNRVGVGSIVSFNDIDATKTLNAGFIVVKGMTAPRVLADCKFTATGGTPEPDDFVVTIVDVADLNLDPVVPPPSIVVTVAEP
jgi:hypothetical protein